MSRIFGTPVQLGHVVPDVQAAMEAYLAAGFGPFFIMRSTTLKSFYLDSEEPRDLVLSGAFSFSGDQQIELLTQENDAPSIFRDFLAGHPRGGLHHLSMWSDDVSATAAALRADGTPLTVVQRHILPGDDRVRELYLAPTHSARAPALTIQIMEPTPSNKNFFAFMRAAAEAWDGADPVREMPA